MHFIEINFVQHNFDLDENFIADLIRRDQNKLDQDLNVNEKNFVQPNFDLDQDFIADLIREDQNKSNQDLNVNDMDFDFDNDFIEDLIRMDQNKSDSVESLPTFNPSSPSPHEANVKHFDYFSPNPPSYNSEPTIFQPFETE